MNEGVDTSQYPSSTEVRTWAQSKKAGAGVLNGGPLPRFVILAWDKAHPDRPYLMNQSHHGTPSGYLRHGCRCDRCLDVGRRNDRERKRAARESAPTGPLAADPTG